MIGLSGKRWWIATGFVFLATLVITMPSVGDFGYTYDEPAYRHSQMVSQQWWERLAKGEVAAILEPDALLYYWPYGRHGINFHPPLAGQLNLLTYGLFGRFVQDVPARRLASVFEFAITVTALFGFLARRYGGWCGLVAAGSLLLMPRLYGQAHLIDTDTPGLLIWALATSAFWKGLHEERAGLWRVLVGVLVGLAFVEKMGAVLVVLPILAWLAFTSLPGALKRLGGSSRDTATWVDGVATSALMLAPLALAYAEIRRLSVAYLTLQSAIGVPANDLTPARTDLFRDHPTTWMPGGILLLPLAIWVVRRLLGRLLRKSPFWGPERPALETWTAILAFGPAIAWLGNPAWWREALPRLAHYYSISTARRGVLPDIQIIYFGQIYEYSLPWHNAWVLIGITVPVMTLFAAIAGLFVAPWRDSLPRFFLLNLVTLPLMRMFPTPAHDGVRLFLPTFLYLSAFAGWGVIGLAGRFRNPSWRPILANLVLLPSAWALINIHPYELSFYNALIGGPEGAWHAGFELSYWYDAYTDKSLKELNRLLPENANLAFANVKSSPDMIPEELQALGKLRGDLRFEAGKGLPFMWLLTHDSKADCFSRLLFGMVPWYAVEPEQLTKARVATVCHPEAVSRAWALQLLLDKESPKRPEPPAAPVWVRTYAPLLARLWGEGVTKAPPLAINEEVLSWGKEDPDSLVAAAQWVAQHGHGDGSAPARRLMDVLNRYPGRAAVLLQARPRALVEAVTIIISEPERLRNVVLRQGYSDLRRLGRSLDADM